MSRFYLKAIDLFQPTDKLSVDVVGNLDIFAAFPADQVMVRLWPVDFILDMTIGQGCIQDQAEALQEL